MALHMILSIEGRKTGSPCYSDFQEKQVAFVKGSLPDIVERHIMLKHVS